MSNNSLNTICTNDFETGLFVACYFISGISLIGLLILLFFLLILINKASKKSLISNGILIITISEILNCAMILSNSLPINDEELQKIRRIIQSFLSIYSDLSTLLSSMVLCIKFYRSSKNINTPLSFCTSIIAIRIIAMFIPLCVGIIFCLINYTHYKDKELDGDEICKPWFWVHSKLSVILYAIYWTIIIIILIFNCKAICHLKHKKEILESNDDTEDCKEEFEPFSNPTLDLPSIITEQITTTVNKLYFFFWVLTVFWLLMSLDRVPDDIAMIINESLFEYKGTFLHYYKAASVGIHSVICTLKGLVFCFCFLLIDHQLFESIKNTFPCNKNRRTIPSFSTEITESLPPNEK